MPVVAITREFATLGSEVAVAVASELNLALVHDEVIIAVAERMTISPSLLGRYMDGVASQLESMAVDPAGVSACLAEQVFELAAKGDRMISGCSATYLLRDFPSALRIRVRASESVRAKRLMQQHPAMERGDACRQIALNDARQARSALRLFNVPDVLDSTRYDMVLDTGSDSIGDCVDKILGLWRLRCGGGNSAGHSPAKSSRNNSCTNSTLTWSMLGVAHCQ